METTTKQDVQKILAECKEKAKIGYANKDGFFTPKLRSINHLEVGYSKMVKNPINLLLEFLLVVWENVRTTTAGLLKKLYRREDVLVGTKLDSKLIGRLTFHRRSEIDLPIHNMRLEFWGRTHYGHYCKLSEGFTGEDGRFELPFELRVARNWNMRSTLHLEVYQISHVFHGEDEDVMKEKLFKKIPIPKSDLIGLEYDMHTIELFFWEYRMDSKVPRCAIKDHDKDAPQYYTQARVDAMFQQIIPLELTKVKHLETIKFRPHQISLESIQADYPDNLTITIEKALPGYTRGDDWFGERMMNGMNRGYFEPDPSDPGMYWMKYFGACDYPVNGKYALPSVRIKFYIAENGLPKPLEILTEGALSKADPNPWQRRSFTPENEQEWLSAKRIARITGSVSAEVDEHFTGTHLNTEQYAMSAHRNLRLNPIAELLLPHLKEVVLINHSADDMLLGQFLPTATALDVSGLVKRTEDVKGMLDWRGYEPMEALSDRHFAALSEQLFWKLTCEYVDWFFERNLEAIKEQWFEVFRFSEDLVLHSVPVYLSNVDLDKMEPKEKALAQERFKYYCQQYGFDPDLPRETIKGELKAVSHITKNRKFDPGRPEEIDLLKKACSYIIIQATFLHTWINEHQYDDLGEIKYSGGGLRFPEDGSDVVKDEDDPSINPELEVASKQVWFVNFLSRTEYGFLTRNEDGDVNPHFSKLLLDHKEDFLKLGVEIENIESRTNI